ncbi:MAG: hypothetical protein ACRDGT_04665 [Candidatus Limnocylindria bacterium]
MAAALGLSGGCGSIAGTSTVAMVSGRDDHGQLQHRALGLQRSPTDSTITGTVEDGTFVRVTRRDGPWAHVVSAGSADEGWIQDHYLRGEAVRIDPAPPRRVTFLDLERRDAAVFVRVRFADDGTEDWIPAASLREVGAR